jgi:outer membrane protein assembly factor BamB
VQRANRVRTASGIAVALVAVTLPASAVAATAPMTSATTLTSSAGSSAYDSAVSFTARITSPAGTPTGSVLFTDASNGSILGTARVSNGTASFTTAALAPGARKIVARYPGSSAVRASSSPAVGIRVTTAASDALAYQVDPRHDGDQAVGGLKPRSLKKKWTVTLGVASSYQYEAGDVSYPVIAGGRVFVTVENSRTTGTELYALNARNGATDWSVGLGGSYGFSALAYDGQRVFALNNDGFLTAFAAGTGHELWATQLPVQYSFTAAPTAYDGVVYVSGSGSGGTVYAVSEAGGVVEWSKPVANGDESSPAVDSTGAYVSYDCQQDYRFSLGGRQVWHYQGSCEGGGGSTAVLHGNSLYARGSTAIDAPVVLSKPAGKLTGTFASATAPAFGATGMFTLQGGNLVAVAPSGSPDRWTFSNGNLVTAPVVNAGVVYVGSSHGRVYGLSVRSGARLFTGTAGTLIRQPDEFSPYILTGMAVGGGLLVVPAGTRLTAFGN